MRHLTIQWHITEQCNWRCTHCYHDEYLEKWPSLDKLKEIFHQIVDIDESFFWVIEKKRINFAWWEPFVRKDFIELLEYINNNINNKIDIWILTNGSFLNDALLTKLISFQNINFFIQISIEGTKKINDEIRWKWAYDTILKWIELCKKYNIALHLSFTLTNINKEEIFKLIPFIKKHDISLNVRRIVPLWQSKEEFDLMLSSEDWYRLTVKIKNINNLLFKNTKWKIWINWCSEVTWYNYTWNWCGINRHWIIVIMHNLDIYTCRRLPITIWNLAKDKLKDIYLSDEYKKQMNAYKQVEVCKRCPLLNKCKW
jgi:radical SAM protein with 4Fe4S-binding SPASM domain